MRQSVCILAFSALLVGCSQDPSSTPVTPALLEDQGRITAIANRLEPDDRAAFGEYVASRSFVASGIGTPLVKANGQDPATVEEAIALVKDRRARHAEMEKLQAEMTAKVDVLRAKRDRLNKIAEAAGWAPPQTEAANSVIGEIEAVEAEYAPRLAALR